MYKFTGEMKTYMLKKKELLRCFNTNLLKIAIQFLVILLGLSSGGVIEIHAEGAEMCYWEISQSIWYFGLLVW